MIESCLKIIINIHITIFLLLPKDLYKINFCVFIPVQMLYTHTHKAKSVITKKVS